MWCGRKFCSAALTETNLPSPLPRLPLKVPQLFRKENKENLNRVRGKKWGPQARKEKKNNERKQNEKQPKRKREGEKEEDRERGSADRKRLSKRNIKQGEKSRVKNKWRRKKH